MDHVSCTECQSDVVPRAPSQSYLWLMVTFWVFSLLFGIGAAMTPGWGLVMLVAWLLLACLVGMSSQRGRSWTCPNCGAVVRAPASREATSGVV